jgi:AraC-like DNA-binding protein
MAPPLPSDHIHARPILGVLGAASALGIDLEEACRRAGIALDALGAPDASVAVATAVALWQAVEALSGDPAVGLAVAERIHLGVLGFVYHSVNASETLRDACRRASRYNRLIAGPLRTVLRERGADAVMTLEITAPPVASLPFAIVQYLLLFWLRAAAGAVGTALSPREVRFVHALRGERARFEAAFGAPCLFEAPRAEIVLPRSDLDRPIPSGDPTLARWLDVQGDAQLDAHERADAAGRVRAAVRSLLARGEPRLDDIAATLHTPARTLQRRLSTEGTTFASLVDDVRRDVALRMVAEASVPLADVAFVTGFSEISAFYRAFRRWTGATPVEWRRRAG